MSDFKNIQELEKRQWDAADELRANTGLTSQEYSRPVLGLIFLRYAEYRYELAKQRMADKTADALFSNLLKLPEDTDIGKAVSDAMKALEKKTNPSKTRCLKALPY